MQNEDMRAILSGASRYYRALAESCPKDGAHATRDNALRLAYEAEAEHARVTHRQNAIERAR